MVDFKDLVKAGVHFGHQTSRWNPRMAPYIWGHRHGIHLIDVSKTAQSLENAAKFLESVVAEGKPVLWVGTKKSAQEAVENLAKELKMPYVSHRWIGGTLTNFPQVKKSVTKLLHFEDIIARSAQFPYTKKELLTFQKIVDRLESNVGGIRSLSWPIGAIVIVDVRKEKTTLSEANQAGIPVVALVDTNSDPSLIDYVIPGNDDSPKAVNFIINFLGEAVKRGIAEALRKQQETKKAKADKAVEAAKKVAAPVQEDVIGVEVAEEDEFDSLEQKKAKKKIVKITKDEEGLTPTSSDKILKKEKKEF